MMVRTVSLPTRRRDWHLVGRVVRLVLSLPAYAATAVVGGVLALSVFVFAQNLELVGYAVTGPLALSDRLTILLGLYPFVGATYGMVTGAVLLVVAVLSGVDVALAVYHFREHGLGASTGSGAVGAVLGALGAGCAACGSAVVAGVLSAVGAAGLLTVLPLDGLEFALLAVVALVLSIHWIARGLRGGEVAGCPIDV